MYAIMVNFPNNEKLSSEYNLRPQSKIRKCITVRFGVSTSHSLPCLEEYSQSAEMREFGLQDYRTHEVYAD